MSESRGHTSGQPPAGLSWADLIASLVEQHGTLTAVAWKLVEHASGDDVASIERALRRLRGRGQLDGGVWGQRLLRVFGLPSTIEARLRWMGLYHSPFNDLPVELCLDQVRVWDRPPVSESRARVWVQLGYASCALRQQEYQQALQHTSLASSGSPDDVARVEILLIQAYVTSRDGGDVDAVLVRAESALEQGSLDAVDRACMHARLVDQRAYQLNRRDEHAAALALYESLPAADIHPFASYRRDAGRAYGFYKLGRRSDAIQLAQRACDHAGDGGYTRLRAMGLILLARILGGVDGAAALARARAIADRLADRELQGRCDAASSR